jgi:hypothetical protein
VQAETTFQVREGTLNRDISLRPFFAWDPRLTVSLTQTTATARFTPLAGTTRRSHDLVVEDRFGDELSLPFTEDGSVNAHLLPPGRDTLRVKRYADADYTSAPVTISVRERSLARGATCVVTNPAGKAVAQDPYNPGCRLTDGQWGSEAIDSMSVCGDEFATAQCLDNRWSVRVDLRKPVTIHDVVLVGPGPGAVVSASADGVHWTALSIGSDPNKGVRSTLGSPVVTARYLRVSSNDLSRLAEVAVF